MSERKDVRWEVLGRMACLGASVSLQVAAYHPWAGVPVAVFTVDLPGLITHRGVAWIMAASFPEGGLGERAGVVL